ncbi:MAG: hypothetical protein ACFFE2_10035 [Candidatus Thorarchaeota archaeon]
MKRNNQESDKELSTELVALAELFIGILLLLMVLAINIRTSELKDLTMLVFGLFFAFLIFFGYNAITSETPEWSANAKRLNGIGSTLLLSGIWIGFNSTSFELGILVMLVGLILILIATLHPNARIRKTTTTKEEYGAEGEI